MLYHHAAYIWHNSAYVMRLPYFDAAQMFRRGPHTPVLLRYNYGYSCLRDRGNDGSCNLEAYGSKEPPEYDLGRYSVPTTIISGDPRVGRQVACTGPAEGTGP